VAEALTRSAKIGQKRYQKKRPDKGRFLLPIFMQDIVWMQKRKKRIGGISAFEISLFGVAFCFGVVLAL